MQSSIACDSKWLDSEPSLAWEALDASQTPVEVTASSGEESLKLITSGGEWDAPASEYDTAPSFPRSGSIQLMGRTQSWRQILR